jgi:integrase/recombinase XerC
MDTVTAPAHGRPAIPVPTSEDEIGNYIRHLEDINRAESTRDHYAEILRRMDRQMPGGLLYAHADELHDWIYQPGRGPNTRNHYREIALGFFKWATAPATQIVDFNPAALLPKVAVPHWRPRPVSNRCLSSILAAAAEPYRRWYLLAAYAGLRCVELAGLDRADVTEDELWVRGKGGKDRAIPTHPLIWAEVCDLDGPLVRRRDGGRASRRYVSARGNRYLHDVLGVSVNMHHLRRWFGTATYVASDRDILAVQKLLGHSRVNTTQDYVDIATESMTTAVAALPVAGVRAA